MSIKRQIFTVSPMHRAKFTFQQFMLSRFSSFVPTFKSTFKSLITNNIVFIQVPAWFSNVPDDGLQLTWGVNFVNVLGSYTFSTL